jgi:hypothetical protein
LHDLNQRELAGDASGDSGLHGNDVRVMDKAVGDHQLPVKFVWKLVQGPWQEEAQIPPRTYYFWSTTRMNDVGYGPARDVGVATKLR